MSGPTMNQPEETEFDEALTARARELATDVQPQRDLWPAIEAAIAEPSRPRWNWQPLLAQAAAVIVLIGGSSGLTWLAVRDDATSLSPVVAANAPPLEAAAVNLSDWSAFDPGARDARRDVERRLEQRLERLPPATRQDVTTNLQTIRSAIADINAALADEPDNALLRQLLLLSYGQELDLMRQVNDIGGPMMMREDI